MIGRRLLVLGSSLLWSSSLTSPLVSFANANETNEEEPPYRPDNHAKTIVKSPSIPWNEHWDFVKCSEPYNDDDDNLRREAASTCKHPAKVTRNLLLIRHGQYIYANDPEKRILTPLGREQAALLGQRLKGMIDNGAKVTKILCSTMPRAKETTQIVADILPPGIPIRYSDLYCEARPNEPIPKYRSYDDAQHVTFKESIKVEAAFRDLFYRSCDHVCLDEEETSGAPAEGKKKYPSTVDEFEIVICHANVIRYFVLRALQLDPHAWLRFSLHNCSLTWVRIAPNGRVSVRAVGDFGHIPHDKATTG